MIRDLRRTLLLLALMVGATGCITLQPYERENLARSDMQFGGGGGAVHGAESHATEVREGAVGGFEAAGGGCGCN